MNRWPLRKLYGLLAWLARTWKTLFAYQFVLVAEKVGYTGEPAAPPEPVTATARR